MAKKGTAVEIEGVVYSSIQSAYNALKGDERVTKSYITIKQRIRYGYTGEQAFFSIDIQEKGNRSISRATNKKNYGEIVVKGETFSSIPEACKHFNIVSAETVYNRLSKKKNSKRVWSIEEAILTHPYDKVVVNGKSYRTAHEAYEKVGVVSFSTFQSRRRDNKDIYECLGLTDIRKGKSND